MARSHEAAILDAAHEAVFALDLSTPTDQDLAAGILHGLALALGAIGSPLVQGARA